MQHLGLARDVVSTERGPTRLVGQPIRLDRTPSEVRTPAPTLGEHSEEILGEIGYDADAIAALRAAGIV